MKLKFWKQSKKQEVKSMSNEELFGKFLDCVFNLDEVEQEESQ